MKVLNHIEGTGINANLSDMTVTGQFNHGANNNLVGNVAHAEGEQVLAYPGLRVKITARDDTLKTITVDNATGLSVGDSVSLYYMATGVMVNTTIIGINGLVITVNAASVLNFNRLIKYNTDYESDFVHAEGYGVMATGELSHAEGYFTEASGKYSHAEGYGSFTSGKGSHAENYYTFATGDYSHAEGETTYASGKWSHAEGYSTQAIGTASHAEGDYTQAIGQASHAEGRDSQASGFCSHVEGQYTVASGDYSHAGGSNTIATGEAQTVIGKYNQSDTTSLFIVGNGDYQVRSNALTLSADGHLRTSGMYTATIGTTWIGTSAPYTQEVTVTGITPSDTPIISPVYDTTLATAKLQKEAWNLVGKISTSTNFLIVTCFDKKPTAEIPIQIKVV